MEECLIPEMKPGSNVIIDNLPAHKVAGIRQAIESANCRLVYLPPYSPDYSPIENIWSKAKSVLRMLEARTVEDLEVAVTLALQEVTAQDCRNCFEECGYSLHLK